MDQLTDHERLAVNSICRMMLDEWRRQNEPCDMVDFVTLMTQGAARACREVQLANKNAPSVA